MKELVKKFTGTFLLVLFVDLLIIGVLQSCKNDTKATAINTGMSIVKDSVSVSFGKDCQLPDTLRAECAAVHISKVVFSGGNSALIQGINDSINQNIKRIMLGSIFMEDDAQKVYGAKPTDSLIAIFGANYLANIKEFPETAIAAWYVNVDADTSFLNEKMICLNIISDMYLGGAHPNYFQTYLNFDKTTGECLSWVSITKNTEKLLTIAEEAFRKNQELKAGANLEGLGYFFEKGIYALPQNFTFNREGIILYYNQYEAAAYALGPITFVIPYNQLADCLDLSKIK